MTFIEKFDSLKKKYGKIDESKLTDNFAVQIEMTDEDCGGIFYVAYMNGPFAIEPYDYHDNTASIKVSSKVLEDILSCKADAMEEFFAGNLTVEGDVGHALMLVELMKKEPAKKTVKKETAKKEAAPKKEKTDKAEKTEKAVKTAKTEKKTEKKAEKKTAKKTAK
ncbi:MAG: SCP2 sterol-binding domain-containing protein [Clostridiales bacterium]|nr:SCP2 sterol-binding domain-containing protein [Clostridiales bacterium]